MLKNKQTCLGGIALERQAGQFNSGAVALINFFCVQKQLPTPGFKSWTSRSLNPHQKYCPLGYQAPFVAILQPILY